MLPAMILRQLIQTGRRFCECRTQDFIPSSEDTIVVIAYSIHDQFHAHSFDCQDAAIVPQVRTWLQENDAIAYILVRRSPKNLQSEFPFPIGRSPMDRVSITAATPDAFLQSSFLIDFREHIGQYRLIETNLSSSQTEYSSRNLLRIPIEIEHEENAFLFAAS